MKPVRMLALSPVPQEGAGARFRIYQYLPALEASGFQVTVCPFFTPEFFQIVYQAGQHVRKVGFFMKQTWARLRLLTQQANYDLFFIYREALPLGPPIIEWMFSRAKGRALVYDFDDAVFLPNSSDVNKMVNVLKYPQKVSQILRRSTMVIAGNHYLADYARSYNRAVTVVPTCVDTTKFVPRPRRDGGDRTDRLTVGWIGSPTTAKYLRSILPLLERVAETQPFHLYVVGNPTPLPTRRLSITEVPWALEREVDDFATCDIGIYPLWDDPWSGGKCGFKAIEFMACGVPVVASAVGVNRAIVQDGVNGFLAETETEWLEKLTRLLRDPGLRQRLGQAGRRTVETRYSLAANVPLMRTALCEAIARAKGIG